jgi:hypothetical protein
MIAGSRQLTVELDQVVSVADAVRECRLSSVERIFVAGKFRSPCIENVKTDSSPAKIAAVPLPWCTSRSTTSARRILRSRCNTRIATATSFSAQNPSPWSANA